MSLKSYPEIRTKRLLLREPEKSDWPVVLYLRSDVEVNKYVKRPNADSRDKALEFIERITNERKTGKSIVWFISLKDDPKMIGSICLWNFSNDGKTAEIGYDLHPEFHGTGIMQEALKTVVNYGFGQFSLNQIEAFTSRQNQKSINLLKRNNFQFNESRTDEENPDNLIFELKCTEWKLD